MRGIVIAGPRSREIFGNVFEGSAIEVEWAETPGEASGSADFALDLDFHAGHLPLLEKLPAPLILLNAVSTPLHTLGTSDRFARINAWNTFLQRPLAEMVVHPSRAAQAATLCTAWKKTLEALPDLPGMPSARVVSMIVNEAYFALGEGVGTKEAIDTAMRLGTNYPFGPFEWGARIGLKPIVDLLENLNKDNPLYTIAPRLREEAQAHGLTA